ncbi:MAG: S41 family peptidase [Candidatus Pacebacteria bacterium]|nr:S41 family peptidase [Candidatus Paceibacterota bacterium]
MKPMLKIKQNSKLKNIILFVLVFFIGFLIGGYYFQAQKVELIEGARYGTIFEAWSQIRNKFYGYSEEKEQEMIYGAIDGIVGSLGDSYSDFLNPKENSQLGEELTGSYEGIGAEITIKDNQLTVVAPLKGTPAEAAGIMANDKILQIDGKNTSDMTLVQAVMKIRGKAGTIVNLKIKRSKKTFNVKIKRSKVKIPVLNFKMLDGNIAYLQIFNFYENTYTEFEKAVEEVLKSGTDSMILDLRGNPGGFLDSAINIGEFFVPRNKIILKQDFGQGKIENIKSEGPASFARFKMIILIDEGSASASEILAGAIKENNQKTILIGEKTFGKGTVQELINLSDSSALKITTAHWLLPSGKFIEGKGIEPDIKIKITEKDVSEKKDPQLNRAIKEIKKK